ncbi:MAG: hypothetical protein ACYDCO_27455 [Armatimonadota bacterium]
MPPASSKTAKKHAPARRTSLLSPWMRNSVRRRWAYIAFVLILLFDAALLSIDLDYQLFNARQAAVHLLVIGGGLGTLAAVYHLARAMRTSRDVGLWAMVMLGLNVPWLLYLRQGDLTSLFSLALALAVLGYLLILNDGRFGGLLLGAGAAGMLACDQPVGVGVLLGIAVHAAWWLRGHSRLRQLAWAAGAFLAAGIPYLYCTRTQLQLAVPSEGWLSGFGASALGLQAWLLPLLTLPLLVMALVHEVGAQWRPQREPLVLALVVVGAVVMAAFDRQGQGLYDIIGLVPVTAVWLALGLDRLQGRVPAWVWAPAGAVLVLTTLPQNLVSWAARAARLPQRVDDVRIARQIDDPGPEMLVPLYPYLREGTVDEIEVREE